MSEATDIYKAESVSEKDAAEALFQLVNVVKYFGADDNDVKSDIAQILKLHAAGLTKEITTDDR